MPVAGKERSKLPRRLIFIGPYCLGAFEMIINAPIALEDDLCARIAKGGFRDRQRWKFVDLLPST